MAVGQGTQQRMSTPLCVVRQGDSLTEVFWRR